jgi:hypothetical protein
MGVDFVGLSLCRKAQWVIFGTQCVVADTGFSPQRTQRGTEENRRRFRWVGDSDIVIGSGEEMGL